MSVSNQQLQEWLGAKENEHLEFKEAKNNFHFEKLVDYCAALANEGGGKMVLGVTDKKPRKVVGCNAFDQPARTIGGLVEKLRLKIESEEGLRQDQRKTEEEPHKVGKGTDPVEDPVQKEGIADKQGADREKHLRHHAAGATQVALLREAAEAREHEHAGDQD